MAAPPRPAFARSWGPPTGPRAPDGLHARADRRAEARGVQASRAAGGCWPTRRGSARAAAAAIARAAGHCIAPALRGRAWVLTNRRASTAGSVAPRRKGVLSVLHMLAHAIGRQPASISALALLTGGEGASSRERAALLPASCRESHRSVELRVKGSMVHPRTPSTARLTPDTRAPLVNLRPSPSRARGTACAPGARASAAESAHSVGCRVSGPPRTVAIPPTSRNRFDHPRTLAVSMACSNVLSRRARRANHWHSMVARPDSDANHFCASKNVARKKRRWARSVPTPGANLPGGARSRPRSARPRKKYNETHPQRQKKKIKKICGGSIDNPRSVPGLVPLRRQRSHNAPPAPQLGARAAPARVSTRPPNSLRRVPAVGFAHGRGARAPAAISAGPPTRRSALRGRCYVWRGGRAGPRMHAHRACAHLHGRMHTRRAPAHRGTHTHAHTHSHTHTVTHTQHSTHTHAAVEAGAHARARRTHSARARIAPAPLARGASAPALPRLFFFFPENEPGPEPIRG